MENSLFSLIPELSVGALSVVAMSYMMIKNNESREKNTQLFLATLDNMRNTHENAMKERENAFRSLEREVRTEILSQLARNSEILGRVINHLDK